MNKCICIDDSHVMFKVIKGAHYWQPVVEKSINEGDLVYFEKTDTGVKISPTDNINMTFIFITETDFIKHFEDISLKRDDKINKLLD
jgi:hypothetical protein